MIRACLQRRDCPRTVMSHRGTDRPSECVLPSAGRSFGTAGFFSLPALLCRVGQAQRRPTIRRAWRPPNWVCGGPALRLSHPTGLKPTARRGAHLSGTYGPQESRVQADRTRMGGLHDTARGPGDGVGSLFRPTDSPCGKRPWPKKTPDPFARISSAACPPRQQHYSASILDARAQSRESCFSPRDLPSAGRLLAQ